MSPSLGILHSDLSVSRHNDSTGKQWGVGWQWTNQRFSASASQIRRDRQFSDMSVLTDGTLTTLEDNAFVSWSFNDIGTLGLSWINRQYPTANSQQQYVGFSWSKSLGRRLNIATSFTQSLEDDRDKTLYINLSYQLSDNQYVSAQRSEQNQLTNNQLSWSKELDSNNTGWSADVTAQQGDSSNTHADYLRRTSWSDWEFGYNHYNHQDSYYSSLSGAVGVFMGHIYATRELGDSFAVVDTSGVPGIPVYLQHQPAGKTDRNGTLFLNDLDPYFKNDITIDVLSLPDDYRALYTEQEVIPKGGGGAVAAFSIYRTHALLITGKLKNGKLLPFAANVSVVDAHGKTPTKGTTHTVVAYEGNIYLEDPPANGQVIVEMNDGDCRIALPARLPSSQKVVQMEAECQ